MVFQTVCGEDETLIDPLKVGVDPDKRAVAGTQII